MRKLIAVSAVLMLAACGEAEVAEEEAAPVEEVAEAPAGPVGNYTWTEDDGTVMSAAINADGTAQIMNGEEVVDSGTWAQTDAGTCFTMENMEEGEEAACFTFGEPGEDGSVSVTDANGEVDTITLVI